MIKFKPYIIFVLVALGVGGLSALITKNNMNIYSTIITPPLSPPGFLFPIVWTILYLLMGVSAALVYTAEKKWNASLTVWCIQLGFNFFWSILFFYFKAFLISFIWLIGLLALIVTMIIMFNKHRKSASYLQIPYLLWVVFAGYLNFSIYLLN